MVSTSDPIPSAYIQMAELPVPPIKTDEVLVKVKAISINPVDAAARNNEALLNYVYQIKGDEENIILGWDISGIITETGAAVTRFKAGDEVFGMVKFVGHYAIQIAKNFGAYVVAVASAANKDFVLSLGADEFIDYRT